MRRNLALKLTILLLVVLGVGAHGVSPVQAADQPDQTHQAQLSAADQPDLARQPQRDAVERLYKGLLARSSDAAGLEFWVDKLQSKAPQGDQPASQPSLLSVAKQFLASEEFADLMASPTNQEFVGHLYGTVLNRAPDDGGFTHWVTQLDIGEISRAEAVLGFTESVEFIDTTGGVAYAPGPHWSVARFPSYIDAGNGVVLPAVMLSIRRCESTNNYAAANRSSTARGAYQFLTKSWNWYGHSDRYDAASALQATPAEQDEAALLTYEKDGVRPWLASKGCWG